MASLRLGRATATPMRASHSALSPAPLHKAGAAAAAVPAAAGAAVAARSALRTTPQLAARDLAFVASDIHHHSISN